MGNLSAWEVTYKTAFDVFMLCAGSEFGDVFQLPYSGGLLQQPNKTMMMWRVFQSELKDHIGKENKKRAQQAKQRRR